tara:strand:- start:5297 stop:6079 length:783 start_codon:yes stop_codon:yes gene_type:complete
MSDTFLGKNYLNYFTSIFRDKEEETKLYEQNIQRNLGLLNQSNLDNLRTAYSNDPSFFTPNFDPNLMTVEDRINVRDMKPDFKNVTDNIYEIKMGTGDIRYQIGEGGTAKKTNITPKNINAINEFIEKENRMSKFRGANTVYTINDTAGKTGKELIDALTAKPYSPAIQSQIESTRQAMQGPITDDAAKNIMSMFDTGNYGMQNTVAKPVMGTSSMMNFLPFLMAASKNNQPKVAPMLTPVANPGLFAQREKDLYSMFRS